MFYLFFQRGKNLITKSQDPIISSQLMNILAHDVQTCVSRFWPPAPPLGDEAVVLENLLDDTVVELGSRRRRYPKVILHHVVQDHFGVAAATGAQLHHGVVQQVLQDHRLVS